MYATTRVLRVLARAPGRLGVALPASPRRTTSEVDVRIVVRSDIACAAPARAAAFSACARRMLSDDRVGCSSYSHVEAFPAGPPVLPACAPRPCARYADCCVEEFPAASSRGSRASAPRVAPGLGPCAARVLSTRVRLAALEAFVSAATMRRRAALLRAPFSGFSLALPGVRSSSACDRASPAQRSHTPRTFSEFWPCRLPRPP